MDTYGENEKALNSNPNARGGENKGLNKESLVTRSSDFDVDLLLHQELNSGELLAVATASTTYDAAQGPLQN